MNEFLTNLLLLTLKSCVLIAVIFTVRTVWDRRLSPAMKHGIWCLIPLHLILGLCVSIQSPWSLESTFQTITKTESVAKIIEPAYEELQPIDTIAKAADFSVFIAPQITEHPDDTIEPIIEPASEPILSIHEAKPVRATVSMASIVFGCWVAGIIATVFVLLRQTVIVRGWLNGAEPVSNENAVQLFLECRQKMNVKTWLVLAESPDISAPYLVGTIRPTLLMPDGMAENATQEQMRVVFLHELAHLKRWDTWTSWIMSFSLVLFWFNPLLWFAVRKMNDDKEEAADVLALETFGRNDRSQYGRSLLEIAAQCSSITVPPKASGMVGISENGQLLTRRIEMLNLIETWKLRDKIIVAVLVLPFFCIASTKAQIPDMENVAAVSQTEENPGVESLPTLKDNPLIPNSNSTVLTGDFEPVPKTPKEKTVAEPVFPYTTLTPTTASGQYTAPRITISPLRNTAKIEVKSMKAEIDDLMVGKVGQLVKLLPGDYRAVRDGVTYTMKIGQPGEKNENEIFKMNGYGDSLEVYSSGHVFPITISHAQSKAEPATRIPYQGVCVFGGGILYIGLSQISKNNGDFDEILNAEQRQDILADIYVDGEDISLVLPRTSGKSDEITLFETKPVPLRFEKTRMTLRKGEVELPNANRVLTKTLAELLAYRNNFGKFVDVNLKFEFVIFAVQQGDEGYDSMPGEVMSGARSRGWPPHKLSTDLGVVISDPDHSNEDVYFGKFVYVSDDELKFSLDKRYKNFRNFEINEESNELSIPNTFRNIPVKVLRENGIITGLQFPESCGLSNLKVVCSK